MQTLTEVIHNRAAIENEVQKAGDSHSFGDQKLFDSVRMDGCVVFDDLIAKRYLEVNYLVNTHLAPHRLPGVGLSIGDIVPHEGKTYLTVDLNVMAANVIALHLIRPHEVVYAEWSGKRDDMNTHIRAFIGKLQLSHSGCFGLKEVKEFTHCSSAVGWNDVGTPSPDFLASLSRCSDILQQRRKKGMRALAREASALAAALAPYTRFQEVMTTIRKNAQHKGFPRIHDGMLQFSTPAASGGATLHTHQPSDDVMDMMPSGNDLFLVAAQAGNISVCHIGAGSLEGEHYFMLPPKTPFFPAAQKKVDENDALNRQWDEFVSADSFATPEQAALWTKATAEAKWEVIKEAVPTAVSERVLGLHVDMTQERRVALVRPVVSDCHLRQHQDAARDNGLSVYRKSFDGLLGQNGDSYCGMGSVFN